MFEDKDSGVTDPSKEDFSVLIKIVVILTLLFPPVMYGIVHLMSLLFNKLGMS